MTSIPSLSDVRQSLMQLLAQPGQLPPEMARGPEDGQDLADDGMYRRPGIDARDGAMQQASVPSMRGEGGDPLSHTGLPAQLADTLSTTLRQNPSQPLLLQLQQMPPEILRQLAQLIVQQPAALNELLAQARTDGGGRGTATGAPEALRAEAEARRGGEAGIGRGTEAAGARTAAPGSAQAVAERMQVLAGRETATPAPAPNRSGEDARLPAPAANLPGRMSTVAEGGTLLSAAWMARAQGLAAGVVPGTTGHDPAGPAHTHLAAPAGTMLDPPALQPASLRAPGDPALLARADGAASGAADPTGSSGGLGLGTAAGVTLAAVAANPAGTTHATAPASSLRTRKPDEAEQEDRKRIDDDTGHDDDDREHARGQRHDAEGDDAPPAADAKARRGRSAPAAAASGDEAAAAALGLMLPAYEDDEASPAGHAGERPTPAARLRDDARRSRRRRWLYWSLIVVAYACLGLALASVAADLFLDRAGLTIPVESGSPWRHGLTLVGLVSAAWAWLLARRMR